MSFQLGNEGATRRKAEHKNIMEAKELAQQRHLASNECKYKKLEGQYNILVEVQEALEAKLDEDIERVQEVCCIRHTEERWLFSITRLVLPLDVFPCLAREDRDPSPFVP
jgi:hypothetical protein